MSADLAPACDMSAGKLPELTKSSWLGRSRRPLAALAALAASVCALATPGVAHADTETEAIEACLASHSEGQELRMTGKLLESREDFRQCAASHCPNGIQRDCIGWLEQIQMQIPSVAFRVTADGRSRADVRVFVDGKLVMDRLSGKSVDLNPGPHELRVELPPYQPFEQQLVVSEGDKFRVVEVSFVSPDAAAESPGSGAEAVEMHRPVPLTTYVFGGVGVAAAISGAAWGISSLALRSDLESLCAPGCPEKSVQVLKQRALVADISWGVSAASIITAGVFYFLRPEKVLEREEEPVQVDVTWLPEGGAMGTVQLRQF